jgi:hypothetical protein
MNSHLALSRALRLGLLAALMLSPIMAWCQSSNGSVSGQVYDQTKAVIPGANVVLTNTGTNVSLYATTNTAGLYVFPSVVPGSYKVTVTFKGMAKFEATLTVRTQETPEVDATLVPGSTLTAVNVVAATPVVQTNNPDLGHTLEQTQIQALPINGRDVTNLLATVPGMYGDRAYGVREGTQDLIQDGSPLTDEHWGGEISRLPGLESIQEFRVVNNADSAKYTRQVSIILETKGGTNQLHGSAFETNRDYGYGVARARDDYSNTVAPYIRNEYGGSVGGPIYLPKLYNGKNKSFFFVSYEGRKIRQNTVQGSSVPTEAERNGDFSQDRTAAGGIINIYNPYTTDPTTYARQQFDYNGVPNAIDPSLESPLAKNIYSILPLPTLAGVNPQAAPNYYGTLPNTDNEGVLTMRFDQRLSEKDTFYVRLSNASYQSLAGVLSIPTLNKSAGYYGVGSPNKSIVLHETHTFSPTLFNEVMLSATKVTFNSGTGNTKELYASELGLPNPGSNPGYPVLADIGVGYAFNGNYYIEAVNTNGYGEAYFVLEDNATKMKGRHELQFGMHLRYDQQNYFVLDHDNVDFPSIATADYDPSVPSRSRGQLNTGSIGSAFYLGLADYNYGVPRPNYYTRQNEDAFYFQDNFRATSRLMLNLGLRWQLSPFPKDIHNIFTSFDTNNMAFVTPNGLDNFYKFGATTPAYAQLLQSEGAKFETAQQAGLPPRLMYNNWHDIGPHLGLAYHALEGKKSFVVRGGMSLNYFSVPHYLWQDIFYFDAPFGATYTSAPLTLASQSPDGIQNYGLVSVPSVVAGQNSSGVINLASPNGITPGSGNFQTNYFDPHQPSNRVYDWNLTIEKELMSNTVLRVAYVGNRATDQEVLNEQNDSIYGNNPWVWYTTTHEPYPTGAYAEAATRPLNVQSGGTVLPYGNLAEFTKAGWSSGNGAQVELERRFSKGIGFQVFYNLINIIQAGGAGYPSYSRLPSATDYAPGVISTNLSQRLNQLVRRRDTTVPQQQINFNWVVGLPFGRGQKFGAHMNKWLDAIAGGWQVAGMGTWYSNYFGVPTSNYPTGTPIQYYGHKYPVKDCTSGTCLPGYLLWNAYIPAQYINSHDAAGNPNGIEGVPSNYHAAEAPLWPYPADYLTLNPSTDPNYGYYGTNTVFVPLNNGTTQSVSYGALNPFINNFVASTHNWDFDASLGKNFQMTERVRLRIQMDAFNAPNVPGNTSQPGGYGVAYTYYNVNTPRMLQLSGHLYW